MKRITRKIARSRGRPRRRAAAINASITADPGTAGTAIALRRAFGYAGRPYDFEFDLRTDAALVCTEVIYKAYEPSAGLRGLRWEVPEILGRPVLPPNELARQFDAAYGTADQQLESRAVVTVKPRARSMAANTTETSSSQ